MRDSNILSGINRKVLNLLIRKLPLVNKWNLKRLLRNGTIIPIPEMDNYLNTAPKLLISPMPNEIHIGLVKNQQDITFKGYFFKRDPYPKYERFLINNNIFYSIYDIDSSKWQDEAEKLDVVIWHPHSSPDIQAEAKSKIYFLEKYLGKKCFPSYDEIWSYEDKVRSSFLYTHYRFPAVPTFTTNSKEDALEFLNITAFPIISKITTGSSSYGVLKLKNKKDGIRYINSCFSERGRKTYWPFERQKNYVYFQKFINDAKYDLRIIVVGNKIFGYYRYAKPGDYRASGSGVLEKKSSPKKQ